MMNFSDLNLFDSFIKTLLKSIGLYQPCDLHTCLTFKASFSFHKPIPQNTQMTTLYTNLSLYITFTMIYYIRQE